MRMRFGLEAAAFREEGRDDIGSRKRGGCLFLEGIPLVPKAKRTRYTQ